MRQTIAALSTVQQETTRPVNILGRRGNFIRAKEIAAEHAGELPSFKEFIVWLKDPTNFDSAKGEWYWLRDEPNFSIPSPCRIDYEKGIIEPVAKSEWDNLPDHQKSWIYSGNGPLAIYVGYFKAGLFLDANFGPEGGLSVACVALEERSDIRSLQRT
jgi:hypothetical protein